MKTCTVDGCAKPARSKIHCAMHHTRWKRHGDPLVMVSPENRKRPAPPNLPPQEVTKFEHHRELKMTRKNGEVHVVLYDHADADFVESRRWHVSESNTVPGLFYARTNRGKDSNRTMHGLLMATPLVDHANHNGLDNRRSNLRAVNKELNSANSRKRRGLSTSQFKGVYLVGRLGRWAARIQGRHLGYFTDEVEAAHAYDRAAVETWGEYALPNFPIKPSP